MEKKMITSDQVYEWVKTGHWSMQQFLEWMQQREDKFYDAGHTDGWNEAEQEFEGDRSGE